MASRPVLPYARAAVFATVCTCLGVLGHVWMSRAPVPVWALAIGFCAVLCLARLMAARECSLVSIAGLMGAGQAGLHLLFEAGQHGGARPYGGGPVVVSPMPGMEHAAMVAGSPPSMRMTVGMLAVHAVAALVCSWWLRAGEARLHRWARWAAAWLTNRLLLVGGSAPAMRPPSSVAFPRRHEAALHTPLIRFTVVRRGPPERLSLV